MNGNKVVMKGKIPRRKTSKVPKQSFIGSVKSRFVSTKNSLVDGLKTLRDKIRKPKKTSKKLSKSEQADINRQRRDGILGIGQLFVVVSIAYSTSVIFEGVDSLESKLVLVPQAIFALFTLLKAFSKLYK